MSDIFTLLPAEADDPSNELTAATAHNTLATRDAAGAHPATALSYDNTASGLTADTVQEALDEIAAGGGGGGVASVNGQTGVVVLDAGDVGAVPTSRTITAGTGLTGGGTLAADRTISADLSSSNGAALGTAAPGVATTIARADHVHPMPSASDVGGVPVSLIDAAGDLIVGTAADTVGRVALGAAGTVLTSDGTTAAWGKVVHTIPVASGQIYSTPGVDIAATTPSIAAVGRESWTPIFLPVGTYTTIGVWSTVAGTATWRVGIDWSATTGWPGAVALDAGTIDMSASPGWLKITGLSFVVPSAQWVWAHIKCVAYTSNPTVYCLNGVSRWGNTPPILGWPQRETNFNRSLPGFWSLRLAGDSGGLTTAPAYTDNPSTGLSFDQSPPMLALWAA